MKSPSIIAGPHSSNFDSQVPTPLSKPASSVQNRAIQRFNPLSSNLRKRLLKQFGRDELAIFTSTFFTVFLAELGDKTQITTLLMSAESQSPWVVFAGAGVALVLTSLLGVLLGRWLSTRLKPKTLETAAAMLLLVIAVWLLWDIVHL